MKLHNRSNRGQGMVEYIIIVVVVGIFCIGIFMALGKGVQRQTQVATDKLTGELTHDSTDDFTDVDARTSAETDRDNLMTGG